MTDEPEPLTLEALNNPANLWGLLDRPLPADASQELLQEAFRTFSELESFAGDAAVGLVEADPAFAWRALQEQANERRWAADDRLEVLKQQEATAMRPQDQFPDAARAALRTPADQTNRDVAAVSAELAKTASVLGTPEHAAFQKAQAERGEKISRAADPAERADLRKERDAAAHVYAAGLADKVAVIAELGGSREGAEDMRKLAGLHREIAGELATEGKTPPEGPTPRDPASPDRDAGAEFAEAAKAVGQGTLGKSAEVVMVAEGPEPQPDGDAARRRAELRNAIMPETVNDFGTQMRTAQYSAPHEVGRHSLDGGEPASQRPGDLSHGVVGQVDEAVALRGRAESRDQQAADEQTLRPSSGQAAMDQLAARLCGHRDAMEREPSDERAGEGPERPSGQDVQRAPGHYASLTR